MKICDMRSFITSNCRLNTCRKFLFHNHYDYDSVIEVRQRPLHIFCRAFQMKIEYINEIDLGVVSLLKLKQH